MQPPSSTRIGPGEIVDGKFRVDRVLGVGGMGFVVSAFQIGIERRVALKFVRSSRYDPESLLRFMREARATVKLRSEHVTRVLDVVTPAEGTPYIVMEYLEGADLGAHLRKKKALPIEEATAFVLQACEAIAEAHAHGIVHRDLKPENLFLTSRIDGRPLIKVLDFGISKRTIVPSSGPDALSLTRTEDLVGSPNYMPPEQLRAARTADARSDIWSLGVILYELVSGRLPFQGKTIMELCTLVLEYPPTPLRDLCPEVPRALSDAVMRCLEKDPARRFQDVPSLALAIEPFALGAERGTAARLRDIGRASGASFGAPERAFARERTSLPSDGLVPHAGAATNAAWSETRSRTSPRGGRPLAWIAVSLAAFALTVGALAAAVFAWHTSLHQGDARVTAEPSADPLRMPRDAGQGDSAMRP